MLRVKILETAIGYISRDRNATHGRPEDTFGRIAALWSVVVGVQITPAQVALMMGLLKIARAWANANNIDNYEDLAGYAGCAGELALQDQVKPEKADG